MREPLPARIVVLCLPGIGDAILLTPALRVLRQALPDAHITAMTMFQGAQDVLETNPDLDDVRRVDLLDASTWHRLRSMWALRRGRFDLAILPFPSNRAGYHVVNRLVGRRWRAGYRYHAQSWRNLWFLNNIVVREAGTRHNLDENLALADAVCQRLGVATPSLSTRLGLHLTADDHQQADTFLAARGIVPGEPLIGMHTFSSTFKNMHRKCWDKERFVGLIERLDEALPGARPVIFSGPADAAVNGYIMRHVGRRALLVELPNLRWSAAVLQRCRLLVSNDSALMHVAAALDVPVVALFGPTDWRRLHPSGVRHRIVRRDLPCMPCFRYSSRPLRCGAGLDYACVRDLPVGDVLAAIRGLLAERSPGAPVA